MKKRLDVLVTRAGGAGSRSLLRRIPTSRRATRRTPRAALRRRAYRPTIRAARKTGIDPDGLAFDRGTAELRKAEGLKDAAEKQRLTERALDDLKQAQKSADPKIRGGAQYNRGNAMMDGDKVDEAIEAHYRS